MTITHDFEENKHTMTLADRAAEIEKEWEERYSVLKEKKRSYDEDQEFKKLKMRLGYSVGYSTEIECEGCGS